jgi:hypothetical protein
MADRQDIDALMVGALYGELDTAERSRLDAHLSSHPEDRAAMQGLEAARATVRRGMIELAPAEPPQAVSAILLQEAARRRAPTVSATEPAEREGLWERFVAWFRPLAGHPALAAAAALILVAGTATALWVRGKGKVTEPTTASSTARAELQESPPPGAANGADSSGYEVAGVVTADPNAAEFHADKDTGGSAPNDERQPARMASGSGSGSSVGGGGKGASRGRKPGSEMGIAVDGKADVPAIKELEDEELAQDTDGTGDSVEGYRNTTTSGGAVAQQPEPAPVDPKLEEWAQQQHQKLVKLVKEGNCPEAGRVGSDLKAKAPDYYAANVANDRDVRQCKQYIEKQAKKKAEKDYKSRSQGNAYDDAETDATE